jgi:hypothetical protein
VDTVLAAVFGEGVDEQLVQMEQEPVAIVLAFLVERGVVGGEAVHAGVATPRKSEATVDVRRCAPARLELPVTHQGEE